MIERRFHPGVLPALFVSNWSVQLSLLFGIWIGLIGWFAIWTGASQEGIYLSFAFALLGMFSLIRLPRALKLLRYGEIAYAEKRGSSSSHVHVGRKGANQILTFSFSTSRGEQHTYTRRFAKKNIPEEAVEVLCLSDRPSSFIERRFLPTWLEIDEKQVGLGARVYLVYFVPAVFILIHTLGFLVVGL